MLASPGLDAQGGDCTTPACLTYQTEPDQQWAYHNAPYTLLGKVLENATGKNRNQLTYEHLTTKIGLRGLWVSVGFNGVFFSDARSMARFGWLIANRGHWQNQQLMSDQDYFEGMITSSQTLNPAYGYLWWLNGKDTYRLPAVPFSFGGALIPTAPLDLIAALGKNDQKIYVVPSQQLVVIRMGESAGESLLAASSFDTQLWERIGTLECP
ncbi:MAG: serine hydrolase [Bernardetiaceae bacterium]